MFNLLSEPSELRKLWPPHRTLVGAPSRRIKIFQFDFNKNEQQLRPTQSIRGRSDKSESTLAGPQLSPRVESTEPIYLPPAALLAHLEGAIMPKLQTCYLIYGVSCVYFWFPVVIFSRLPPEMPYPHIPPAPAFLCQQHLRATGACAWVLREFLIKKSAKA